MGNVFVKICNNKIIFILNHVFCNTHIKILFSGFITKTEKYYGLSG